MPVMFLPMLLAAAGVVGVLVLGAAVFSDKSPARVMIIGLRKAGKTSWINGLQGKFESDYIPTLDSVTAIRLNIGPTPTAVNIRDSSGGASAYKMWSKDFQKQHLVLLFVDGSSLGKADKDAELQSFISRMSDLKLGSRFALVITHTDLMLQDGRFESLAEIQDLDLIRNLAGRLGGPKTLLATTNTPAGCQELARQVADILRNSDK